MTGNRNVRNILILCHKNEEVSQVVKMAVLGPSGDRSETASDRWERVKLLLADLWNIHPYLRAQYTSIYWGLHYLACCPRAEIATLSEQMYEPHNDAALLSAVRWLFCLSFEHEDIFEVVKLAEFEKYQQTH